MTTIKAIETQYKGYRFRSRLEARWAVFFDALNIKWEYEKEGFDLGETGWYLPDFWLPESSTWFEVKGGSITNEDEVKLIAFNRLLVKQWEELSDRRHKKWEKSQEDGEQREDYEEVENDGEGFWRLLTAVGTPYCYKNNLEYKLLHVTQEWKTKNYCLQDSSQAWCHCPLCGNIDISHYDIGFSSTTNGVTCMYCDMVNRNWKETKTTWFHKGTVETTQLDFILNSPKLKNAYTAARSARFEHGEKPFSTVNR